MNLMLVGLRTKQVLGQINTVCKKCGKLETTLFYDANDLKLPAGSFTKRCLCGTWIYKFHNVSIKPDPNNPVSYFTKAFISASKYDPNYKSKNFLERNGFNKAKNGKYVR